MTTTGWIGYLVWLPHLIATNAAFVPLNCRSTTDGREVPRLRRTDTLHRTVRSAVNLVWPETLNEPFGKKGPGGAATVI